MKGGWIYPTPAHLKGRLVDEVGSRASDGTNGHVPFVVGLVVSTELARGALVGVSPDRKIVVVLSEVGRLTDLQLANDGSLDKVSLILSAEVNTQADEAKGEFSYRFIFTDSIARGVGDLSRAILIFLAHKNFPVDV